MSIVLSATKKVKCDEMVTDFRGWSNLDTVVTETVSENQRSQPWQGGAGWGWGPSNQRNVQAGALRQKASCAQGAESSLYSWSSEEREELCKAPMRCVAGTQAQLTECMTSEAV